MPAKKYENVYEILLKHVDDYYTWCAANPNKKIILEEQERELSEIKIFYDRWLEKEGYEVSEYGHLFMKTINWLTGLDQKIARRDKRNSRIK